MCAALLAGVAMTLPASAATPPPSFTPNHLFVGGQDLPSGEAAIFEFHEDGSFARKILTGSVGDIVYGVTFGADGSLYCTLTSAQRVVRIEPNLNQTTVLNSSAGLTGETTDVKFGPQGRMYVASRDSGGTVLAANPNGTVVASYTAPASLQPSFITFSADGHVFVTLHGNGVQAEVHELSADLQFIRTFGNGVITGYPANLLFARNDTLLVPDWDSGDKIRRFDATGAALADLPVVGLNGPFGLATGPDGSLFIANWNVSANQIVVVNPDTGAIHRTITHPELSHATGLAFGPHRFRAQLKGTLTGVGTAAVRLAEPPCIVSVSPGSGTVLVSLTDGPTAADISSVFPDSFALVFNGKDAAAGPKALAAHGASVSRNTAARATGSITVTEKGATDTDGYFTPKSISGSIHLSRPGAVLNATFTTSKRAP